MVRIAVDMPEQAEIAPPFAYPAYGGAVAAINHSQKSPRKPVDSFTFSPLLSAPMNMNVILVVGTRVGKAV